MQVFDDQQARALPALAIEYAGDQVKLTPTAHARIHCLVNRSQLARLRQVQQVIEENRVVGRHHTR